MTKKTLLTIIVALLLLPVVIIGVSVVAGAAHASWHKQHHGLLRCDSHHWKRYLGVSPYPNMMAEMRVNAHACMGTAKWAHKGHHRVQGEIVRKRTDLNVRYQINGWGRSIGLEIWKYHRYRTSLASNAYNDSLGYWSKQHQCQTVAGVDFCAPTGSFVPYFRVWSPHLIARCGSGCPPVWDFRWHEGEPGKAPNGYDANIKIRMHD